MIHAALILTLIVPSVSDRSRGGGTAFDGVFEFDADLDGTYKLYGDKTDDSNTYIYRSGADEWTVVSGGIDALICDASYCTFASGPKVGASIPFADAAGTLTLQNIDALDATTETTIESAIDTLGDISVGSIAQGDDKSVCQGADTDWCCEWDTDGTEGLLCTATDCDGIGTDCNPLHLYQDSGNLIADLKGIDSITNSSQKITVGPAGASSHSTGANQCHFTCTQEEHEAVYSYFDGSLVLVSNGSIYVSGKLRLYSGTNGVVTCEDPSGGNNLPITWKTGDTSSASDIGGFTIQSGNALNAGDYDTGNAVVATGYTVTDGDTGDVQLYSGVAGAGIADAGDIIMSVNGAPGTGTTLLSLDASDGAIDLALLKQSDIAATCTIGEIEIDTGGATIELCYCQAADTWYCTALAAGPTD